jgi:hypothetical protein
LPNGLGLVASTQTVLPHRLGKPPSELPQWQITAIAVGALLAFAFIAAQRKPTFARALMLTFWCFAGFFGTVMLLLWLFSAHRFAFANENLLLLSPLAVLLPALFALRERHHWRNAYVIAVKAVALMAVMAAAFKLLGFSAQSNMNWLLLILPLHAVVCRYALREINPKPTQ